MKREESRWVDDAFIIRHVGIFAFIALTAILGGTSQAITTVLLEENYDQLTVGTRVPSWSVDTDGYSYPIVQDTAFNSGTRGARISPDVRGYRAIRLFPHFASGIISVEIWMKSRFIGNNMFGFESPSGAVNVVGVNDSFDWIYMDQGIGQRFRSNDGNGHRLRAVFDTNTWKYDLYFDDTLIKRQAELRPSSWVGTPILGVGINSQYGTGYFDDLRVTLETPGATPPVLAPSIASLSISRIAAGGNAFTIAVTGRNFVSGSRVQWNGSDRSTIFVSSTQLTALITAADIAVPGASTLSVANPAPAESTSAGRTIEVNACSRPISSLTSIQTITTKRISGGALHAAALGSDGSVSTWGDNQYGQLGSGTSTGRSYPSVVFGLVGVVAIASGDYHVLALKSDGSVWAWGNNTAGQLGDGSNANRVTPVRVCNLGNVVAVAAGGDSSLALTFDGTLWSWGGNRIGQLGRGDANDHFVPEMVGTGFATMSVGGAHSTAVKQDGTLWGWGDNYYGQLGIGGVRSSSIPLRVPGLPGVVEVGAGQGYTVVRKSDGTVWGWGYNLEGQLGNGAVQHFNGTPIQARIANVVSISTSRTGNHTMALRSDGSLWIWGGNAYGQLGFQSYDAFSPNRLQRLDQVTHFDAGIYSSYAVLMDGTVRAWGRNTDGQGGDGTYAFANLATPTVVINETANGPLDLIPEVVNSIPEDQTPPFLIQAFKTGDSNRASLAVDIRGTTGAGVFAATHSLGQFATGGYNIYVAASSVLSESTAFFQLDAFNRWSSLTWPMLEFARGVNLSGQNTVVSVQILRDFDISQLPIGAQIYLGYGIDSNEMLSNRRFRTVFTVDRLESVQAAP